MKQPRHMLYIFADQLCAHWVGCMGNEEVKTPVLDALAAEGQLFKNCYSTSPVCTPYRGALMSGLYPTQSGCFTNEDGLPYGHPCMADLLNNRTMHTTYIGKWHLFSTGAHPIPRSHHAGWSDFIGYSAHNDFINDVRFYDEHGNERRFNYHRTRATTDLAIERVEQACARHGRIAQMVSYQAPHYPLEPDPAFYAMYAQAEFKTRVNFSRAGQDGEPGLDNGMWPFRPTWSPNSPRPMEADPNYQRYGTDFTEYRRHYAALVTQFDYEIGRLMNAWRRLGLWDEAAVIINADHGEMQGAHGCPADKGVFWEESVRVPCITKFPGAEAGVVYEEALGTLDLRATILDALGAPRWQQHSEGTSFMPLLRGESFEGPPVFIEFRDWIMVRDQDWKLAVDRTDRKPHHLFDLKNDPYEMNNLVDTAPEQQDRLHALINKWWTHCQNTKC